MELSCKITNVNSSTFKNIILRKFFQILFISENFNQIDVYSAVIVGGGDEDNISKLTSEFSLGFEFVSENIKKTCSVDLTADFLEQFECVKGIWGKGSEILKDQHTFESHLNKIFSEEIKSGKFVVDKKKTNLPNKQQVVLISDPKKATDAKYLTAIAKPGLISACDALSSFSVDCQNNVNYHCGLELINWVRTSLVLDKPISENEFLEYQIVLEPCDGSFFLPDFTFYISPPPNYLVELDTASVKRNSKEEPSKDESKSEVNMIQSVGRADPLYYSQWKTEHHIESRKMSRLIPKSMISEINKPSPYSSLLVKFTVHNPSKQPIVFFLLGILLSSAMAFGSDYTRITSLINYFPCNKWIQPDLIWIVVSVMSFLTIFISSTRLKERDSSEKKFMKLFRIFVVGGFVVWIVFLFVFLRISPIPFNISNSICKYINTLLFMTTLIFNVLFLGFFLFNKKIASNYAFNSIFSGYRK